MHTCLCSLASCGLTSISCETIKSTLQSQNSLLKGLELGFNDLLDSGVTILSDGLAHRHCNLEGLRLAAWKGMFANQKRGHALLVRNVLTKKLLIIFLLQLNGASTFFFAV